MKIINIQDISKYPTNYNFLTEGEQSKILSYMNGMDELANSYYKKYFKDADTKNLQLYQHMLTGLTGAKNAYATLGIMVEKWGTNNEWILATKVDATNYNETEDQITEVINEIDNLLSYEDIL